MSENFLPSGDPARFEAVMGFQLAIWEPGFCQFRVPLGPQHLNRADLLVCEGKLMKSGRSTFFAEARLLDGDDGALLASGQGAYKFLK